MVGRIVCTKCTLHSNHSLTRVIFQNTKRLLPRSGHFSQYIHSHFLAAEMWTTMINSLLGKKIVSCSFYLYRFRKYVSYGFLVISFCNPGVHFETPCISMEQWHDKFQGEKIQYFTHKHTTLPHFFTTNFTRNFLEFNPLIRSEKKGSNQFSCGIEIGI